ncbi:globin-like protein [Saitoella complicata NRRL Y-17804]|uniref:globin-like protein n=1 Tax=Saitoella complicata (strain BCRC 22490 / CBS 7301 / JCM 7358 / NBRC 10748 / NRRL Y-17804) TaxID=698492 RepID=UPI000866D86B|nr:globin-like protein [Saitoella complicata NRRL Y-17804]ODQ51149.1 globin-like protein [Saitoella complicata NRRL Y-17804]
MKGFRKQQEKKEASPPPVLMSEEEIKVVRDSWYQVMHPTSSTPQKFIKTPLSLQQEYPFAPPLSPASLFTYTFYSNLFILHPELRSMFSNIHAQSAALAGVVSTSVNMLNNIEALAPKLEAMGRAHRDLYNVKSEMYETVGEVLLLSLRERLGEGWSGSIESAWAKLYGLLASAMIKASDAKKRKGLRQRTGSRNAYQCGVM